MVKEWQDTTGTRPAALDGTLFLTVSSRETNVERGSEVGVQFLGADIPIILLSGMAADERLFQSQLAAFPNLRVQSWIPALTGESLREYAARLAPLVDPGRPCIIGGASFGGVVALEMAQYLPTVACILIGSIRSPSGLPWRWRLMLPVAWLGPDALRILVGVSAHLGRRWLSARTLRQLQRLTRPDAAFVRWAMAAVVRWRPSGAAKKLLVFHIHGANDRVLPVARSQPDVIVPGGGHALSLFHPSAVNDFIAAVVTRVEPLLNESK
jgi:pimeloyl-ACP methyl ester carboxylesterase